MKDFLRTYRWILWFLLYVFFSKALLAFSADWVPEILPSAVLLGVLAGSWILMAYLLVSLLRKHAYHHAIMMGFVCLLYFGGHISFHWGMRNVSLLLEYTLLGYLFFRTYQPGRYWIRKYAYGLFFSQLVVFLDDLWQGILPVYTYSKSPILFGTFFSLIGMLMYRALDLSAPVQFSSREKAPRRYYGKKPLLDLHIHPIDFLQAPILIIVVLLIHSLSNNIARNPPAWLNLGTWKGLNSQSQWLELKKGDLWLGRQGKKTRVWYYIVGNQLDGYTLYLDPNDKAVKDHPEWKAYLPPHGFSILKEKDTIILKSPRGTFRLHSVDPSENVFPDPAGSD